MSKLLRADFLRLRKDKTFLLGTIFMAVLGAGFSVFKYIIMKIQNITITLDEQFFMYVLLIGIVMAVFCSLFIGKDYSDGTIRNKITSGHTRVSIYLSNLIVCMAASVIMCFAYFAMGLAVGVPILGFFKAVFSQVLINALCALVMSFAFSSIFLLVIMLNQNKAVTAVTCILLAFALLFSAELIYAKLNEPEYYEKYSYVDQDGEIVTEPGGPNPYYVGGTKRKVLEFTQDFLPGGQTLQLVGGHAENPGLLSLYSCIIIILTTGVGIVFFKKKDIK